MRRWNQWLQGQSSSSHKSPYTSGIYSSFPGEELTSFEREARERQANQQKEKVQGRWQNAIMVSSFNQH